MHNIHTYHISISTYGFILYLTRPFPTLAFLFSGTNLVWSIISTSPIRTLAPDFRRKCLQVFWRTWDMFVLKMFWKLPKVERVTRIHETKASQVWQLLLCLVQDAVPWEHQAPIPTPEQMWSIETSTSRTASSAQFRALHGPSRFSRKGPLDFVFSMVVCVVSYSTFNSLGMLGSWITIRPSLADYQQVLCFTLRAYRFVNFCGWPIRVKQIAPAALQRMREDSITLNPFILTPVSCTRGPTVRTVWTVPRLSGACGAHGRIL